jgi:hypothetical protein
MDNEGGCRVRSFLRKGGVPSGCGLRLLCISSRTLLISMLIRYLERSILVGCACHALIGQALVLIPILVLVHPAFPSFHHLRSVRS